jgi:predicted Na+-dependent transporter
MNSLSILAAETANQATVVNEFEQTLLRVFILIIMFGLGAGLTPKDFGLALRRPWGLVVGWVAQFGIMPLTSYVLIVAVLIPFSPPEGVLFIALGALIMGSVPAGTTSNLFTYFSKGNVALSVTMTVNSTLWAFIMTPLALWAYSNLLGLDESLSVPPGELATVIVGLIIPVGIGMLIRKLSANIGSMIELLGSVFGLPLHSVPDRSLGSKKLAVATRHPVANLRRGNRSGSGWNACGVLHVETTSTSPGEC